MKYISKYIEYLNEEWSKNDPIPELNSKSKLGIILLGAPGVGKSTFVNKFIIPRNQNIKTFSTDDVSLMFTKDPNKYHGGSSELNLKRLRLFMNSGQSFIYDTTGTQRENITNIQSLAKSNGYDVVFIHIIAPLDVSLKQNIERDRHVSEDYIRMAYERQFGSMSEYSKLGKYYIVQNKDGKYKFNKYNSGRLLKRKSDRYLVESKGEEIGFWDIADALQEYADEGHHVVMYSANGFAFYLDSTEDDIKKFRTSINYGDVVKYRIQFRIDFEPYVDYNRLVDILSDVKSTIGRFASMGWFLRNMSVPNDVSDKSEVKFKSVEFTLIKKDRETGEDWLGFDALGITYKRIANEFQKQNLDITGDPEYDDDEREVTVNYDSTSYSGEDDPADLAKSLIKIRDYLGASDYEHVRSRRVTFKWN